MSTVSSPCPQGSDDMTENTDRIILAGIARYAEANKSDPFTTARCLTHFRMGLLGPTQDGLDGHYDAERDVAGWRNIARL